MKSVVGALSVAATAAGALAALGTVGSLAGCAQGAPPGFSQGQQWTFPLVDPLANGRLLTPVFLDGRGPYLMAIDPDALISQVDREALPPEFPYRYRIRMIDESDVSRPFADAEIRELQIGDLTISLRDVGVSLNHTFDRDGRRIYGILGRDIIADSLVFGFDRDRGVAYLVTQEAFRPPAGAAVLDYHKGTPYTGGAVIRRLVTTDVDGKRYDLHLDLGDVANQLRAPHWPEAGLQPERHRETLIDEIGTHRDVSVAGVAAHVTAGTVARDAQVFVPYEDRRWQWGQLEGTLGLAFFAPYDVAADWHHERYYLSPRVQADPALRLGRWGAALPCAQTGCVAYDVARPNAGAPSGELGMVGADAPPAADAILHVVKDPAMRGRPLEVVLGPFTVNMPANVDELSGRIDPRYTSLPVTDVSPFPQACAGGCIVGAK